MNRSWRIAIAFLALVVVAPSVAQLIVAGPAEPQATDETSSSIPHEAAYEHFIRVRIKEVTPLERIGDMQLLKLKVERWYGKIDMESWNRAREHETQEFTLMFPAKADADVRVGDLINYRIDGYSPIGRQAPAAD